MQVGTLQRASDVLVWIDAIITEENHKMNKRWPEMNLEWRNDAFTHFFIPNGIIWSIKRRHASFTKNVKGGSRSPNDKPLLYILYEPGTCNAWAIWGKEPPDLVNYRSWYSQTLSFKTVWNDVLNGNATSLAWAPMMAFVQRPDPLALKRWISPPLPEVHEEDKGAYQLHMNTLAKLRTTTITEGHRRLHRPVTGSPDARQLMVLEQITKHIKQYPYARREGDSDMWNVKWFLCDLVTLIIRSMDGGGLPEAMILEEGRLAWEATTDITAMPPSHFCPVPLPLPGNEAHWLAWNERVLPGSIANFWWVEVPRVDLAPYWITREAWAPLASDTPGMVLLNWSEAIVAILPQFIKEAMAIVSAQNAMKLLFKGIARPVMMPVVEKAIRKKFTKGTKRARYTTATVKGLHPRASMAWVERAPSHVRFEDIEHLMPPCIAQKIRQISLSLSLILFPLVMYPVYTKHQWKVIPFQCLVDYRDLFRPILSTLSADLLM